MTPSALTPAARGTTERPKADAPSRPSTARSAGHAAGLRRQVASRSPRRVSGPASGAATVARPAVAPRTAPGRTGAARTAPPRSRPRSRKRPAAPRAPWRIRSAAYVRALPDHALLDRIIRGRAWIPILGVLLVGIVAMQVEVLKLNAGTGRSLERASALQSQNELLRAGVARLSDEQRIERLAAAMGMVMPAPDQMRFVRSGPAGVETALDNIKAPNAGDFLAQLPTIGAPAAAQGTVPSAGVGTTTGVGGTAAAAVAATATAAASTPSSAAAPGQSTAVASTPATSSADTSGSTATGTSGSTATGTPGSAAPATAPATAVAPTTAGTTSQSSASSTGGATPVGG